MIFRAFISPLTKLIIIQRIREWAQPPRLLAIPFAIEELTLATVALSIRGFRQETLELGAFCGSRHPLRVFGHSEKASELWFAPAGFNRGGLSDGAAGIPITNVSERLVSADRDTLYENRINPIASFPSSGIVVFGQKTLQETASALDRINVRRLVIYLKKQISILANRVLFEQNVAATWLNFKGLIEPLLANTQTAYGISDYRLILDDTTTTPDLIDQNILYAKIMVKPTRAIEYIAIDFVIMSTGASFDD